MPVTTPSEGRPGQPLRIENLRVSARQLDGSLLRILSIDGLKLAGSGRVAVTGPSGAGKSTLLGAVSGMLQPSGGRVQWGVTDISSLPERERDRWRRRHVGLVFQEFHLIPELCVLGNVLMPASFESWRTTVQMRERAEGLLANVGLKDPRRRAGLLSRGEQQRTAIARALLYDPAIILADEPTASLDEANGRVVIDLLVGTAEASGATLLCVTHDPALIARLRVRWPITAGRVEA